MKLEGLYTPNKIRTYTGKFVDPFNMRIDDICIDDIAFALSNIPRFGGHTKFMLSVAEHSLDVSKRVPRELKKAALLHDGSEAYLLDIPKPIKDRIPEYVEAEHRIMKLICEKFQVDCFHADIKLADKQCLEMEWKHNVLDRFPTLAPLEARILFYNKYNMYR